ncbi:hypothetical protein B0H14DRAFT_2565788 [Mycena olivaceomarginata]|nr:hypothetical protein B0H14DRAFT_2565788 [Mycena olivaceomarginata]
MTVVELLVQEATPAANNISMVLGDANLRNIFNVDEGDRGKQRGSTKLRQAAGVIGAEQVMGIEEWRAQPVFKKDTGKTVREERVKQVAKSAAEYSQTGNEINSG